MGFILTKEALQEFRETCGIQSGFFRRRDGETDQEQSAREVGTGASWGM